MAEAVEQACRAGARTGLPAAERSREQTEEPVEDTSAGDSGGEQEEQQPPADAPLVAAWKKLAEQHGLPWPDAQEESSEFPRVERMLSDCTGRFVTQYEKLSASRAESDARIEAGVGVRVKPAPHFGKLRTMLFLTVSYHLQLFEFAQKKAVEASFRWSPKMNARQTHAFVWNHVVNGAFLANTIDEALRRSAVSQLDNDQIKEALESGDPENVFSDDQMVNLHANPRDLMRRLRHAPTAVPKWQVAYVLFTPNSYALKHFSASDVARLLTVSSMDHGPHVCTLADVCSALQGVVQMERAMAEPDEYKGLMHVARTSVVFRKWGVRNAVDALEDVYVKDAKKRMERFRTSFLELYDRIVAPEPPQITKQRFGAMSSTERSEYRIGHALRLQKDALAKAQERPRETVTTIIEAVYNVCVRELVRKDESLAAECAKDMPNVLKTQLYDDMKNLVMERNGGAYALAEAFMWLKCANSASSVADFWWSSQGARAYYELSGRSHKDMSRRKEELKRERKREKQQRAKAARKAKKRADAVATPPGGAGK